MGNQLMQVTFSVIIAGVLFTVCINMNNSFDKDAK
jgi:hypothetical protein